MVGNPYAALKYGFIYVFVPPFLSISMQKSLFLMFEYIDLIKLAFVPIFFRMNSRKPFTLIF